MSLELKVKAASLAAEAVIIRRLERKLKKARAKTAMWIKKHAPNEQSDMVAHLTAQDAQIANLYAHRTEDVRSEARDTHLARMFMKGLDYANVERFCWPENAPDMEHIKYMVDRYDQRTDEREIMQAWARFTDQVAAMMQINSDVAAKKTIKKNDERPAKKALHNDPAARLLKKEKWLAAHPEHR